MQLVSDRFDQLVGLVAFGSVDVARESGAGMRRGVHGFERVNGDVGVDLSRVEARVTKHLLDKADIGAAFEHERGHGVAKDMARARFANTGFAYQTNHHGRERFGRYRQTIRV